MLDRWRLKDFAPGEGLGQGAHTGDGGEDWIEVSAPGDTYLALISAGRLTHPFEERHEADAGWVRDREWWWRTGFETPADLQPGETLELVFEGLDTFADIYLDGALIGRTDNMFRTYAFDITATVGRGGGHTLAICFAPPSEVVAARPLQVWSAFTDRVSASRRNLMRKAQFGWGWDWGPDLPTVGIWRPVSFQRRCEAFIKGVNFTTLTLAGDRAEARVDAEIAGRPPADARLEIRVLDPEGMPVLTRSVPAGATAAFEISIPSPRLWWTADLGEQPLYTLEAALFAADAPIDRLSRLVGVRTLVLDTSDDPADPGTSFFRFCLNGVPIFAKGACWVPASSFVAEIEEGRYRDLLQAMVTANMNMVRVWGGGIYEPDVFYDLCDSLGLLVWQDFMFACAHYPEDDPDFVKSVCGEIEDQVRRLRGHACLALWCGNNENQAMHHLNTHVGGDDVPLGGRLYYDEIMPKMLAVLDPDTPYWPSSPWGGPSPNSMRAGDVHNWTVWHGIPPVPDEAWVGGSDTSSKGLAFTRYEEDHCRFVSEFGIQSAPEMATLKRWMDPADLSPHSEGFLLRVKDAPDKAHAIMAPETGVPRSLEDYVDFSMWTQAVGLTFGIEHFRRRTPACSGALIWQMNDCWPCVSWSLIDYDGVRKASYFAVARAFAPVLASFKALGEGRYELWITNDTLEPIKGLALVELARLDGERLWSREASFDVAATTSVQVWSGEVEAAPDRLLSVRSPDGRFSPNRKLLAPIAELPLEPVAGPEVTIEQTAPDALLVTLTAPTFVAFVHVTSDQAGLRFSDNYFDMAAGETREVVVRAPGAVAADAVEVRCWNAKTGSAAFHSPTT